MGIPTRLVKMPMGISKEETPRMMSSAIIMMLAPIAAEIGTTRRLSAPNIIRTRWGTMSPIQPMTPATAVAAAGGARPRTIVLLTPEEVDAAMKLTPTYRAPGA